MKGLETQALALALAQLREGSFGKRAGVGQGPLQNGGREPVPRARNKLQAVRASGESLYPVDRDTQEKGRITASPRRPGGEIMLTRNREIFKTLGMKHTMKENESQCMTLKF